VSELSKPNIVVLISGSGSNLQAFIDAINNGFLNANISAVISNRPGVFGLERAEKAHIKTTVIDHKKFEDRESFDSALGDRIEQYDPDVVILAGFMRILTPSFIRRFKGTMLNIHPSLLPKYPGLNTHKRAIQSGDNQGGATIHFVTEELDGGPPILQAAVDIEANDTPDDLATKVLGFEHKIYPLAAKWLCQGRLKMDGNQALLDGQILPNSGCDFHTVDL